MASRISPMERVQPRVSKAQSGKNRDAKNPGGKTRNSKTKRERVEEKEAHIIDAARSVFLEKGMEGTRMSAVARQADVAEGTLYLYFKNKDALLHAISREHWAALTYGAQTAIAGKNDTMEALFALADYHMNALIADWPLVVLGEALSSASEQGRLAGFKAKKDYAAIFDMLFVRGVDRGEIGKELELWLIRDLFYGTLEYSARTIMIHDRPEDVDIAINGLMQILDRALSPPQKQQGNDGANLQDLQAVTGNLVAVARRLERISDKF